nr:MAG TPA: hypothetical protein [Caudoviricetes sp.]
MPFKYLLYHQTPLRRLLHCKDISFLSSIYFIFCE